jgi:hypothetical protein
VATPAAINLAQAPSNITGGGPAQPSSIGAPVVSDIAIRGALVINPAYAGDFVATRYRVEYPVPGNNEPAVPRSKAAAVQLATNEGPNAWKKRTLPAMSNAMLFGNAKPQAALVSLRNLKLIPPLALFNDASQWVNRLLLHPAMTWFGAATSDPPLLAQYFTPPPINISNLAGGTLNLQLQLGQMDIQAQQLTVSASNYFG